MESSRDLLNFLPSSRMDLIESRCVSMVVPDPWNYIIIPLRVAHVADVEEAWDHAAESIAVHPSRAPFPSPQPYFKGSTQEITNPAPELVFPSPRDKH